MKQLLLICAVVALVGCSGTIDLADQPELEKAIRESLKETRGVMPTGELTKADLDKVASLIINSAKLTSVKGLEKLTKLEELYLHGNQLTDVKGLEKLTQLKELDLGHNQLTDLKGLEKLTKLEVLDLHGNKLTDLKGLEKLTQLKSLIVEGSPDLTKAQIDELQKALPKCKIEHTATK